MVRKALAACLIAMPIVVGCSFQFDPAATVRYYRAEGWELPGIHDFDPKAPLRSELAGVLDVRAILLPHGNHPYVINLPAQIFTLNGETKKMRPVLARATVMRLELNGRVFGYEYAMIPVEAHRSNGAWKIDSESLCVFSATFIDETGKGVFIALFPGGLAEPMIPEWVHAKSAIRLKHNGDNMFAWTAWSSSSTRRSRSWTAFVVPTIRNRRGCASTDPHYTT